MRDSYLAEEESESQVPETEKKSERFLTTEVEEVKENKEG